MRMFKSVFYATNVKVKFYNQRDGEEGYIDTLEIDLYGRMSRKKAIRIAKQKILDAHGEIDLIQSTFVVTKVTFNWEIPLELVCKIIEQEPQIREDQHYTHLFINGYYTQTEPIDGVIVVEMVKEKDAYEIDHEGDYQLRHEVMRTSSVMIYEETYNQLSEKYETVTEEILAD